VWWRRIIIGSLIAGLPVARGTKGAYDALRAAAAPVLARGEILIVFPEGTRSPDGTIAPFHSGAVRLARDCRVPVVPVTLVGTGELLPMHGRLRPRPVEVRIGTPIAAAELDQLDNDSACTMLRDRVTAVSELRTVAPVTSRVWQFIARRAAAPTLLALSFGWGVAEAFSWPVLAEMYLVLWVAAVPRRVFPAALALWAGSVVGVVTHAVLVRHGFSAPMPLTTARMATVAAHQLQAGPSGVIHQALNGIPVKVYADAAGRLHTNLAALAAWTALERGARILAVAGTVTGVATLGHRVLRRFYGCYLLIIGTTFALALHATVATWR
jgi:1-acyl-sn-glycerol-3-phosphate acyltransferase